MSLMLLAAGLTAAAQNPVSTGNTPLNEESGEGEEVVFTVVEDEPEFPGGMEAMYQYLVSNVQYPEAAKEKKVTGKVYVSFVVERDGRITEVKLLRCPDETLGEEAMRVVKAMPRWKAGRVKGKKVRAQYVLPINFTLN